MNRVANAIFIFCAAVFLGCAQEYKSIQPSPIGSPQITEGSSLEHGPNHNLQEVVRTAKLVPPNKIVWFDAFDNVTADVVLTYTKRGVEQDIILRSKLPDPRTIEALGLGENADLVAARARVAREKRWASVEWRGFRAGH